MRRRGASAVFLATAALASGASLGPDDALAMVQQEYRRSGDRDPPRIARTMAEAMEVLMAPTTLPPLPQWPEYDEGMRIWLKSFYGLMREKGDVAFRDCCALAKRQSIMPYESWGEASEDEQRWWEENNCNMLTGAVNPDEPMGVPLCPNPDDDLGRLLPKEDPEPFAALSLELKDGLGIGKEGPGCDEEDREELNNSYVDRARFLGTGDQCQEFYLIRNGVKWDNIVPCISELYGVTHACSRCYTNFLQDVGGNNVPESRGCLQKCMGLGACRAVSDCGFFIDECSRCVAPAIKDYNRCLGGPIYNALTLRRVFEGMFLYKTM